MGTRLTKATWQRTGLALSAVVAIPLATVFAQAADESEVEIDTQAPPVAQPPEEAPRERGGNGFEALDADGDGAISREEYSRSPRREGRERGEDYRRGDWDGPPSRDRYRDEDSYGRRGEAGFEGRDSDHRPPPPPRHSSRNFDDDRPHRGGPEGHARGPRRDEMGERGPDGCAEHGDRERGHGEHEYDRRR